MESRILFECMLGMHVPAGQVQLCLWNMRTEFQKDGLGWPCGPERAFHTGNGEVAWLEKKGYEYTALEIDVAKWIRNSTARAVRRSEISP